MCPTGRDGEAQGRGDASIASGSPGPDRGRDHRQAELEALAALVAGEFANLLAPVLGNATLLAEELPADHVWRRRVEGIREAAMAARALGQRLAVLDGRRKLVGRRAEAGSLLSACLPALQQQLPPDVAIERAPAALTDLVRVDRKQIELALTELIRNACEAMAEPGVIYLDESVQTGGPGGPPTGRWLRLRVRDAGRGMEPALLARAFDPFVTTKVPCSGAGLGLTVVAAVARQHGGFVEATSEPGHGTTVSLYLPCLVGATATQPETPAPAREVTPAPVTVPGAAILLVEDNAMVRRSIEATLRSVGYRVTSVDSGERCLEALGRREEHLDLVISDVVMPAMSGEELSERVRALRPDLPVLFISGYDRSTLARRKQGPTSEHFLQKPFDSEDLFAAVRAAMASRPGSSGA